MSTLYEQLGGEGAVDAAVNLFYRKVLADDRIARFFDDIDMDEQIVKQKAFLTMAFGGPNEYTGRDMRESHARLVEKGLDDSHFDAVAGCLNATLEELSIPQDLLDQVMTIAAGTRDDVLGREISHTDA